MNVDACYKIGYVLKSHGVKGEVDVLFEVDAPEQIQEMESVFIEIKKKLVPFFIEAIKVHRKNAIIKFEDVNSVEDARELKFAKLYLPKETISEKMAVRETKPQKNKILNYRVIDQSAGDLGPVGKVQVNPGQDLLIVNHKDKEIMIPVNEAIILKVDHQNKKIIVDLPEGLLDLYI